MIFKSPLVTAEEQNRVIVLLSPLLQHPAGFVFHYRPMSSWGRVVIAPWGRVVIAPWGLLPPKMMFSFWHRLTSPCVPLRLPSSWSRCNCSVVQTFFGCDFVLFSAAVNCRGRETSLFGKLSKMVSHLIFYRS